jgi:hypothetical protein
VDGKDWMQHPSGTCSDFLSVASAPNLAITSADGDCSSSAATHYSSNKTDWMLGTQFDSGTNPVDNLIVKDGLWAGSVGSSIARSTDGVNWDRTRVARTRINALYYDGTQYLAIDQYGDLYNSIDATTWNVQATEVSWQALAHNPGSNRSVIISDGRNATSLDNGASWSFKTGVNHTFSDVTWSAGLNAFVAIQFRGSDSGIYTSTDGLMWVNIGYANAGKRIAASESMLVNATYRHLNQSGIAASTDGINWTLVLNTDRDIQDLLWSGSQFIAVGHEGTVLISTNGTDWQDRSLPTGHGRFLKSGASSADKLVVIGAFGAVYTSNDNGQTWTSAESGTDQHLSAIAWTGSEFVAVGEDGVALYSADGNDWTVKPTQYNDVLFSADPYHFHTLLWTGSTLIGAGTRGLIATSPAYLESER